MEEIKNCGQTDGRNVLAEIVELFLQFDESERNIITKHIGDYLSSPHGKSFDNTLSDMRDAVLNHSKEA